MPGSRRKLGHQRETLQEMLQEASHRRGEVRRAPETWSGSRLELEGGRGSLGKLAWPCGVTKMRIMAMMTVMKVFLGSGAHREIQRRWWGS